MVSPEDVEPDLRGVVLGSRARRGNQADYDKLLGLYRQAKSPQVQLQLAAAMCAFRQPELIKSSLDLIKSDDVRRQDALYWLSYLLINVEGRAAAWAWIKDNWGWLVEKFGDEVTHLSVVPKLIGRSFASREMLSDYQNFFKYTPMPALTQPIAQGEENLQWQTVWVERDHDALELYFEHWQPPAQSSPTKKSVTAKSSPAKPTAASSQSPSKA
jgi:aminopeptidase N